MLGFGKSKNYRTTLLLANLLLASCPLPLVKASGVYNSTCTSTTYVGVTRPEECRGGTDFLPSASRMYIMTDARHTVHCCGQIIGWRFQASARAMIRPIDLMVWRPVKSGLSQTFQLLDRFEYWYIKDVTRTVQIDLKEDEYVDVDVGDVIGWHTPLGDVLDYKVTSDTTRYIIVTDLSGDEIKQGQQVRFSDHLPYARGYGLQAILKQALAPVFMQASQHLTFKCPLASGAYLTSVRVQNDQKNKTPVTFNIEGYNPWFQIEHSTGVISTKSAVNGNLTNKVVVRARTSRCAVSFVVLSLQCIEIKLDEKEGPAKNFTTSRSQLSHEEVIHIPFLESRLGEVTIFYANNETQRSVKNEQLNYCQLNDVQPPSYPGIFYTSDF